MTAAVDWFSLDQVCGLWGVGQMTARRRLKQLQIDGERVQVEGRRIYVTLYPATPITVYNDQQQAPLIILQGIYSITHQPSGRMYVGKSKDIETRWRSHAQSLKSGTHHNRYIQELHDLNGLESLQFQILEEVPLIADLSGREIHWIKRLQTMAQDGGLNVAMPGVATYRAVPRRLKPSRAEQPEGGGVPFPAALLAQVRATMKAKGLTQQQVADALGVDRIYINRMLSGNASQVPGRWAELLILMGLELTVKQRD